MEVDDNQSQGLNSKNVGNRKQNVWSRLMLMLKVEDVFYTKEYKKIGQK